MTRGKPRRPVCMECLSADPPDLRVIYDRAARLFSELTHGWLASVEDPAVTGVSGLARISYRF